MLTKAMPLQPMGAVSPKQYPAGQVVQIVSEATSSKVRIQIETHIGSDAQ